MKLRCRGRVHGIISDGVMEVKCPTCSRDGAIVFHHFDVTSGDLVETRKFQDPKKLFESNQERNI